MPGVAIEFKLTKDIGRRDILLAMAHQPNSDRLMVGSSDFKLYSFDLANEKNDPASEALAHESYVTGVAHTETCVVTGGFDRRLVWWPHEATQPLRTVQDAHQRFIRGVQASPDGKFISVSVGDDIYAPVWESNSGTLLHELRGHQAVTPHSYPPCCMPVPVRPTASILPRSIVLGRLLFGEWKMDNRLHNLNRRTCTLGIPNSDGIRLAASSVTFSPDGQQLAVGGMGQVGNIDHLEGKARVEVFNWKAGEKTHTYSENNFKGLVESLVFHPSGLLIAAGGDQNGFIMCFDLADPKKSLRDEKAPMHIHELALNETGDAFMPWGTISWPNGR